MATVTDGTHKEEMETLVGESIKTLLGIARSKQAAAGGGGGGGGIGNQEIDAPKSSWEREKQQQQRWTPLFRSKWIGMGLSGFVDYKRHHSPSLERFLLYRHLNVTRLGKRPKR